MEYRVRINYANGDNEKRFNELKSLSKNFKCRVAKKGTSMNGAYFSFSRQKEAIGFLGVTLSLEWITEREVQII